MGSSVGVLVGAEAGLGVKVHWDGLRDADTYVVGQVGIVVGAGDGELLGE